MCFQLISRRSGCIYQHVLPAFRKSSPQLRQNNQVFRLQARGLLTQQQLVSFIYDSDLSKDVKQDTVLYENNSRRFFYFVQGGSLIGFGLWVYLGFFFQKYVKSPTIEDEKKRLVQANAAVQETTGFKSLDKISSIVGNYKTAIVCLCIAMAYSTILLATLFTIKNVQSIILKKGGKQVLIRTLAAIPRQGRFREIAVPLKNVSSQQARTEDYNFVMLKLKGYRLYFLISKDGVFMNPELFDRSVGMTRSLK
ncbi:putative transmembrane protein [Halotydeus destructor]|nr:putative transmembrane protein [Halotydeus destructor]